MNWDEFLKKLGPDMAATLVQTRGRADSEWGSLVYRHVWLAHQHLLLLGRGSDQERLLSAFRHLLDAISLLVEERCGS